MIGKTFDFKDIETRWRAEVTTPYSPENSRGDLSLLMPPPNVTGALHIGHALSYTLQDIWIKFHTMDGYRVYARPGLDHAGIATQMVVEKRLQKEGLTLKDMTPETFRQHVLAFKEQAGQKILKQLKELGVSAAWDEVLFTLDRGPQKAVRRAFVKLYEMGLIFQNERLVYWDTQLQTVVSNLETVQEKEEGVMWTLRYDIVDADDKTALEVATTRPETIFGDLAIAVHPEDKRFQSYVGHHARVPLDGRHIPIVSDENVDPQKGTGCLKVTPSHDFTDFDIGERHHLGHRIILDEAGFLNTHAPKAFQKLTPVKARQEVCKALDAQGFLLKQEKITHSIPRGDRSGTILEPKLTKQWFLDTKPLAQKALKALQEGKPCFIPENYKKTYQRWFEAIEPWCLSRQLWWGHELPVFYAEDGRVFVSETKKDAEIAAEKFYGQSVSLVQDKDVLDTWFSSALWPFVTLDWPQDSPKLTKFYPNHMLVTGFDIIFFWVARMVMMGQTLMDNVPFKEVYIHGLVRDKHRKKMSKTRNNVVLPSQVSEKFSTDALRLCLVASHTPGHDSTFSEEKIKTYRNFLTKIWNSARFCFINRMQWQRNFAPHNVLHPLNHWILSQAREIFDTYHETLKKKEDGEAAKAIYRFVWSAFCDNFIESTKTIFAQGTEDEKEETRATGAWVLGLIVHMLYPFCPFITSELWSYLAPKEMPLRQRQWTSFPPIILKDLKQSSLMDHVFSWVSNCRQIRSICQIPPHETLELYTEENFSSTQKMFIENLARLNIVEKSIHGKSMGGYVGQTLFRIGLPDGSLMETMKKHLCKKTAKLEHELNALVQKLEDPSFQENAPPELRCDLQKRKKDMQKTLHLVQSFHLHE